MTNRMGKSWSSDAFYFLWFQNNYGHDCSYEIKRHLLLGRKAMINLHSIFKGKDIILPKKVCIVKTGVVPVVTYRCENWTIKSAEHWRIGDFKLWCWKRLMRDPWTAWKSNQSVLKEINPEYSLEGLMLKLQYFSHLMKRADSLEKTLMLGKTEGQRRRQQQRMRWLEGITNSKDMNQQIPGLSVGQQRSHTTTKQKSQEAALSTSQPDSGPHTGAPSRSLWPYDLRNRNWSHLLADTVRLQLSCLNLNATGYSAIRDLYLQFKPPEVQMGLDPVCDPLSLELFLVRQVKANSHSMMELFLWL